MMLLAFFVLPMLLTLVASAIAIPMLVAMHVRAAEAPMAGTVEGWDDLLAELDAAEVDATWGVLADAADEIAEWNALMTLAWGEGPTVATVTDIATRRPETARLAA